jgi:hypothetical protein
MKTLEIIHLRLTGGGPQNLLEIVRECVGPNPGKMEVRFYRQGKLPNDFAVHIHGEGAGGEESPSEAGIRLTCLLKDYGMVAHSVWSECCRLDGDPKNNERRERTK